MSPTLEDDAAPMLAVTAGSDGDGSSAQPSTDSRQYQAILPRRPAIGDFLLSCHTRSLPEAMKTLYAAMVTCPLACYHEQQLVEGMAWYGVTRAVRPARVVSPPNLSTLEGQKMLGHEHVFILRSSR